MKGCPAIGVMRYSWRSCQEEVLRAVIRGFRRVVTKGNEMFLEVRISIILTSVIGQIVHISPGIHTALLNVEMCCFYRRSLDWSYILGYFSRCA